MKSYAEITTTQAARIAKRLVNHWKHKFAVDEAATQWCIHLPAAQVTLVPHEQHLTVEIDYQNAEANPDQLEHVVLDHLERMGQSPIEAHWHRA